MNISNDEQSQCTPTKPRDDEPQHTHISHNEWMNGDGVIKCSHFARRKSLKVFRPAVEESVDGHSSLLLNLAKRMNITHIIYICDYCYYKRG